jgi:hypothetical protein
MSEHEQVGTQEEDQAAAPPTADSQDETGDKAGYDGDGPKLGYDGDGPKLGYGADAAEQE